MNGPRRKRACVIEQVGKARTGRPRYWCRIHGATATGRYGVRLAECEAAYRETIYDDCFELDEESFPGGVALWGAVAPVYDTSGLPVDAGIHVHARREPGGPKEIDRTYAAVSIHYRPNLFDHRRALITQETAVNHYISHFLEREIKHLFCIHCGEIHLDADYFAVHPHRRHLCHGCGRYFHDDGRAVSNPIALLREQRGDLDANRRLIRPERTLDIRQADYPGGVQIWASNPAILWTAKKPEEAGIHVHLYDGNTEMPVEDNTFGAVRIDGIVLDEAMVQHLMAQQALSYLRNKIANLQCPSCAQPHFDQDDDAFYPHKEHTCAHCGGRFFTPGSRRLVVSNPLLATLGQLSRQLPTPHGKERR